MTEPGPQTPLGGWRAGVFAVVSGAVAALGQAPLGWSYLALVGFVGVIWLAVLAPSPRAAAARGWLSGLGYFGAALPWIVEPFLVDTARTGWMAPFALVFMAGGMALFWGAGSAVGAWFGLSRARRAAGVALALAAAEALRGHIFTGFPWALPAYLWIDRPGAQWLAWVGPYGLTAITLLICAGVVANISRRRWIAPVVFALLPVAVVEGAGLARLAALPSGDAGPIVRLVQPNAPQHLKWDPEMIPVFYQRALDATAAAARVSPALVVWPETSLPNWLDERAETQAEISSAAGGAKVILGALRRDGTAIYNSLAVLGEDGGAAQIYDKHHLVPFGEYVPFRALMERIGLRGLAQQGGALAAGSGPQTLDLGALGQALPLICYEAIFPRNLRGPTRPDLLVQITNDAWFGTYAGPFQHLAQARARAIELGVPMVRAANTGVSAVIAPSGAIVAALPLGEAGYVDAPVPPPLSATLYAKGGDWPVFAALLIALLGLGLTRRTA